MGARADGRLNWQVHLRLGRVSNLPTVWTNTLAGVTLAGGTAERIPFAALVVAFSLFYVGGMYLNDAFDREIDARERPERPIPSGQIRAAQVFGVGFGMLAVAILILAAAAMWGGGGAGWPAVAAGLALAASITYYDVRHKGSGLSPLIMGLCRVLVYVTAALAVAGRLRAGVIGGAAVLLCYLVGLTYVAKQETLAEYQNLWPLAFLFVPFVYGIPTVLATPIGAGLYLGFLAWVCYAVSLLVRKRRPEIPRAVVSFIAGISLLDALLIQGAGYTGRAGWAAAGFVLTLFFQRWVRGT